MAPNLEQRGGNLNQSKLTESLWWIFLLATVLTSLFLSYICLFGNAGALGQTKPRQQPGASAQNAASPSTSPQNIASPSPSQPLENKVASLEGQANEMSKRIEEAGNHASQVLNVIGLLIGFISVVVAIGLWQSKQYIDRAVRQYKVDMQSFIEKQTEEKLNASKASIAAEFTARSAQELKTLNDRGDLLSQVVLDHQLEAEKSLRSLSKSNIETSQRVGVVFIERLPRTLGAFLDSALQKGLVSEDEVTKYKKDLDLAVFTQKEVLRALVLLESDDEEEVITGTHLVSALHDESCLPYLKLALSKWSKKGNQRIVNLISSAYERLMAVQLTPLPTNTNPAQ